ncbi:hypothetical protein BWI93_21945 [Siphonobacter sp. BAB-5385]|uniref:hypothetical protein n=1 Tax=Siphonobacter sp. BAB-5385 TaxID=1864822 RepID=UPI000B9EA053|nr:hypothetical protein [Siphonobacter sp. BAB-5385]OZI06163.1 hypothetical protein BWI93_21945 [Siphonobacter sp. BAB-5385]
MQLARQWELTGFYSRIRRDANQVDSITVSSLQTSGLHRTAAEISDKASLLSQDWGGHLRWQGRQASLGFTYLQTRYDKRLQRADRAYNQYEFAGHTNTVWGFNYTYLWRNMNFFGEAGRSSSGGVGVVSGVLASFSKRWDGSLIFRRYDRNFHSFYGNAFSENSRNINETGLYLGGKYTPNRRWQVGAYLDYFRFPWLKYLVDQPSQASARSFGVRTALVKRLNGPFRHFTNKKKRICLLACLKPLWLPPLPVVASGWVLIRI